MIYKDFQGKQLSALGMGTMRLPKNPDGTIDKETTAQMIDYALKHGLNYFDTAWKYHGGASETVIGEILSAYPRESFYLADKFPGFDLSFFDQMDDIFREQLRKCQVEYFDFYLCHNVCERNIPAYFDPEKGAIEYFLKQKAEGKIRHFGFSTHAELLALEQFLERYATDFDFCQIQLNYLDWDWQKASQKVELLRKYGLPIWVMEPLRGGRLAVMPESDRKLLGNICGKEEAPHVSAFRFLQTIPEVTMILSGMSDMEQLRDNIEIFAQDRPLDEESFTALGAVGRKMIEAVPCTACRYCTEYCPQELDIPKLMRIYNEHRFADASYSLNALPADKKPSCCVGCRQCESVCPQNILVSEKLKELAEA